MSENIYKNNSGQFLLKGIFYEVSETPEHVLYTLKEEDHDTPLGKLPSLKRLYLLCQDPTEYEFATKHLGGWSHWKKIQDCNWFLPHLLAWREEFAVREKAKALSGMMEKADGGNVVALRYVLDNDFHTKDSGVGRPTKEKIRNEANKLFRNNKDLDEDFDRILQ